MVVAEALGGSERDFARLMTAKARELGMMHTNYHNASGLPDEAQITTARDQSILARALQDRFPKYFHYFSTRNFVYRGKAMRNHNHLLDRVVGVDGIKTGYIREFGFNIVTSVHRGNRRIVAVVFGGRTAGWRDARVRSLIEGNIAEASVKRTAPLVVERWEGKGKLAAAPTPAAAALVHIPVPAAAPPAAAPAQLGSTAPIKPHAVKTVTVMVAPNANNGALLTPPPVESHTLAPPSPPCGAYRHRLDQESRSGALAAGQARAADHRTGGGGQERADPGRARGQAARALHDPGRRARRRRRRQRPPGRRAQQGQTRTRRGRRLHRKDRQGRQARFTARVSPASPRRRPRPPADTSSAARSRVSC